MCDAIVNDCKVPGGNALIELKEVWPCLKHVALTEHSFWNSCSASSQVAPLLKDYRGVADMVCDMANFVFLEQPAFKGQGKAEVAASDLKSWVDKVGQQLPTWVGQDVAKVVDARFLSVCMEKQKNLVSSGLSAVLELVKDLNNSKNIAFSESSQKQMLLKIPKAHEPRPLVSSFLEANVCSFGASIFPLQVYTCRSRAVTGGRWDYFILARSSNRYPYPVSLIECS